MSKVLAVLGALAVLAVCVAAVGGSVERYALVTGMRVDGGLPPGLNRGSSST